MKSISKVSDQSGTSWTHVSEHPKRLLLPTCEVHRTVYNHFVERVISHLSRPIPMRCIFPISFDGI